MTIPCRPGDVVSFPFRLLPSQDVKERPAIILFSSEEKQICLAIKVTKNCEHEFFQRHPIKRWEAAGLKEKSWAQIDHIQGFHWEEAIEPYGRLQLEDFKQIISKAEKEYRKRNKQ